MYSCAMYATEEYHHARAIYISQNTYISQKLEIYHYDKCIGKYKIIFLNIDQ